MNTPLRMRMYARRTHMHTSLPGHNQTALCSSSLIWIMDRLNPCSMLMRTAINATAFSAEPNQPRTSALYTPHIKKGAERPDGAARNIGAPASDCIGQPTA